MGSTMAVTDLQEHLSEVLARVEGGEEILVSRDGHPALRLVPASRPVSEEPRVGGQNFLGVTYIAPDFDGPMTEEELAEWGI